MKFMKGFFGEFCLGIFFMSTDYLRLLQYMFVVMLQCIVIDKSLHITGSNNIK